MRQNKAHYGAYCSLRRLFTIRSRFDLAQVKFYTVTPRPPFTYVDWAHLQTIKSVDNLVAFFSSAPILMHLTLSTPLTWPTTNRPHIVINCAISLSTPQQNPTKYSWPYPYFIYLFPLEYYFPVLIQIRIE